ncbi:DsbA family protein [Komagataeibacter medellinensis]|uniref:Outer membrane protein n=1 Tax=Komagataeibacter medellinensis (strain NBRC 3288 / BCRC 11682 / LMG 1693 / Kondo 51) TaxID=634177 RepID=G2I1U4_KOMMN|nr:DsbA family protein [Komagataeibacter medellinensis]BAK84880.1 outer membrane protein [Komagataeibacter medellinensis NBRC 3288]
MTFISPRRYRPRLLHALLAMGAVMVAMPDTGHAADPAESFTPAQRQEIVAIMRNALRTDPTILSDAIAALRSNANAAQQNAARGALESHRADLLTPAASDAILGNPQGHTTVVEFYDPRCPYCRKVLPDLDRLTREDKDLRIVEKVIPVLGQGSLITSQALVAAFVQGGQAAYFRMQAAVMGDSASPTVERMRTLATQSGLNATTLATDMNGAKVTAILQANMELARAIGLDGTPTFVFNARQIIPGAVGYDDLKKAIAQSR